MKRRCLHQCLTQLFMLRIMQFTPIGCLDQFHRLYTGKGTNEPQWDVKITHSHICAVIGSSVVMPCTFTHPPGLKVTKVYWCYRPKPNEILADIDKLDEFQRRVQCVWKKNKHCTLKLNKLTISDKGEYYARIETNDPKEKWTSKSKVLLFVKELSVVIPEPVMEATTVKLVCNNTCSSTDRVIWRKNGQDVQTNNIELILQNVSTDDAGNYSCAIKPYEEHPSRSVTLNVMFPPRTPSISVSPADQTLEGATVTLTCSSDANPAVENYTWYYHSGSVASTLHNGINYNIGNVSSEHTGHYYCEAKNIHGASSSTVYLDVYYAPRNISTSLNQSGEILEGSSVTLTCSSDANPPVENYTWYRKTGAETVHMGTGEIITFNLTSVSAGLYHCEAQNSVGALNSTAVEVNRSGYGEQTAPLVTSLSFLMVSILLIGFAWWRSKRAKSNNDSQRSDNNTQTGPGNVYDEISAFPLTSDAGQRVDSGDPDDVQYATVQFKSLRKQQVPLNKQQRQDMEVEYTAVHFSRPHPIK